MFTILTEASNITIFCCLEVVGIERVQTVIDFPCIFYTFLKMLYSPQFFGVCYVQMFNTSYLLDRSPFTVFKLQNQVLSYVS